MKAYVICCNDSVECVVIGSEGQAQKQLRKLRAVHLEKCKQAYGRIETKDDYKNIYFWLIHTVPCEIYGGLR